MGETYYRLPMDLFHLEENTEYFIMPAAGDGMIYAGIHDNDYLVFKKTDSPKVGSIVVVEINGQNVCRRLLRKEEESAVLRRENNETPDLIVSNCTFKGELVTVIKKCA